MGLGSWATARPTLETRPFRIGTDNDWKAVAAGEYHSVGLKADGSLWAWGYAWSETGPARVGTDNDWAAITAAEDGLALKGDGSLWHVGFGMPQRVGTDNDWFTVTAGSASYIDGDYRHYSALKADGSLYSWGVNFWGQLGNGTTDFLVYPSPIPIGTDNDLAVPAFTVTEPLLAELIALRATVTDRNDGRKLDVAIEHLTQSLAAELWVDETHLERKHGGKVFHEEQETVRQLCDLMMSNQSSIPDVVLQGFIDRIFRADRLLASVAIQAAITTGVSSKKIELAQKFLVKGDARAGDDKCANGIEDYRNDWKHAGRAKVSPPVRL